MHSEITESDEQRLLQTAPLKLFLVTFSQESTLKNIQKLEAACSWCTEREERAHTITGVLQNIGAANRLKCSLL